MGSLDVDSLFTNIPFEETINICTELIYDQIDSIEGLNKSPWLLKSHISFLIKFCINKWKV